MQPSKIVNLFHLLLVFPTILLVIYKDKLGVDVQFYSKNLLRILVLLGILNHSYKFFNGVDVSV